MEEDLYYKMVKDKISTDSAVMVTDVKTRVDEIIKLLCDKKPNDVIIAQLKNIIMIVNDNSKKLYNLVNDLVTKINDISEKLNKLITINQNRI